MISRTGQKTACVSREGYTPRMTASRHLIGKDSLIISLAVSINLEDEEEMNVREGKDEG